MNFQDKITDVFFDLDHTLWDFERNSALTFQYILQKHQIGVDISDFLKIYVPINFEYWKLYREERISKEELRYGRLKKTFDTLRISVGDEMIHVLSTEYIEYLPANNYLFDHTHDILDYLKPKYRLHIITNGFKEVQNGKLANSKIDHFFEHVINSEMVGVKKPNRKIFDFALDRAGVAAENSLMVGDNLEADIIGAKSVGMETIHFNVHDDDPHDHGVIIHSLLEIKSYL